MDVTYIVRIGCTTRAVFASLVSRIAHDLSHVVVSYGRNPRSVWHTDYRVSLRHNLAPVAPPRVTVDETEHVQLAVDLWT